MTLRILFAPIAALLVGLALAVGGCASTDTTAPAATSEAVPLATGGGGTLDFDAVKSSPEVAAYVAAYQQQFPTLAEGRSDSGIANDVVHICLDDLRDPTTGQPRPDGDAAALAKIPARTERNGIVPDAATAQAILDLAKTTVCNGLPAS